MKDELLAVEVCTQYSSKINNIKRKLKILIINEISFLESAVWIFAEEIQKQQWMAKIVGSFHVILSIFL